MPEHRIPPTSAPFFAPGAPQPPSPSPVANTDVGTTALVQRLQVELDAAFSKQPEVSSDVWKIERDAEIDRLKDTLTTLERNTSGAINSMVESLKQQQVEQAKQLRELFEEQARHRPKRIRTSTGKVYEVES